MNTSRQSTISADPAQTEGPAGGQADGEMQKKSIDILLAHQGNLSVGFDGITKPWSLSVRGDVSASVRSLEGSEWKPMGKVYTLLRDKAGLTKNIEKPDEVRASQEPVSEAPGNRQDQSAKGKGAVGYATAQEALRLGDVVLLSISEPDKEGNRTVFSLVQVLDSDSRWGFTAAKSRHITTRDIELEDQDQSPLSSTILPLSESTDPYQSRKREITIAEGVHLLDETIIGGSDVPIVCYNTDYTVFVPAVSNSVPILLQNLTAFGHSAPSAWHFWRTTPEPVGPEAPVSDTRGSRSSVAVQAATSNPLSVASPAQHFETSSGEAGWSPPEKLSWYHDLDLSDY